MKRPALVTNLLLPTAVGLFSLALTGWLWQHERETLDASRRADFDFSVRQAAGRIEQRIATYEQMLRAARGLFNASDDVSASDFRRFVDDLIAGTELSGLQAMIFTPYLASHQIASHVATRRRTDSPGYTIEPPPGGRDPVAPVTYIAPDSPINRRALGHDLFTSPPRREAMLQARDSGTVAISPKIHLKMDQAVTSPAFAIYLAVYEPGRPTDSVANRQAALRGWVHIAFRIHDLMASLYGEIAPGVALRIYDGTRTDSDSLMFDSDPDATDAAPPRFATTEYISFPQHTWALRIRTTPAFDQHHSRRSARIIAIGGGLGSLLLALFTWQLTTGRSRAHARAQVMTCELRASEERMRHMAQHDPLTQLPNRALFSDRLQAALARARRDRQLAGLMFVDLDRFKTINDLFGHAVGDRLLVAASARMRECLRESDTLARLGGDEFVVLLPHIDSPADAELVAERIRATLVQPFGLDGHELHISASVGIGIYPDHGLDDTALMKSADDAMYRAKDVGGNRLNFASHPVPAQSRCAPPPPLTS